MEVIADIGIQIVWISRFTGLLSFTTVLFLLVRPYGLEWRQSRRITLTEQLAIIGTLINKFKRNAATILAFLQHSGSSQTKPFFFNAPFKAPKNTNKHLKNTGSLQ